MPYTLELCSGTGSFSTVMAQNGFTPITVDNDQAHSVFILQVPFTFQHTLNSSSFPPLSLSITFFNHTFNSNIHDDDTQHRAD